MMYRVGTINKHIDGSKLWIKLLDGSVPAVMVTTHEIEARTFETYSEAVKYVIPGYAVFKV